MTTAATFQTVLTAVLALLGADPGLCELRPGADELPPQTQDVVWRTAHYEIRVATDQGEARDLGRALEAAWEQLEEIFQAAPDLDADERVRVHVLDDRDAWYARIRRDGAEPPAGARFVHYRPENDAIYVQRSPTPDQTRTYVLHGACQQFHVRCKAKNRDMARTWVSMGMAEHLAVHTWDGETLRLGALPVIAMRDMPARAREFLDPRHLRPEALLDEGLLHGEVCFALVRYLMESPDPERREGFAKRALGLSGSKLLTTTYLDTLGDPVVLYGELMRWLHGRQQPMRALTGWWEDLGAGRIAGTARPAETSVALFEEAPEKLSAQVRPDRYPNASGGLVFDHREPGFMVCAEARRDGVLVRQLEDWAPVSERLHELFLEPGQALELTLERQGARVRLSANGVPLGEYEVESAELGVFALGGRIELEELRWR